MNITNSKGSKIDPPGVLHLKRLSDTRVDRLRRLFVS